MNVYAELGGNAQQVGGDCPEGWIAMFGQRPDDGETQLYTAQADGTWAITEDARNAISKIEEDAWCVTELVIIDNQLDALEEAEASAEPTDLRPGTRLQWLQYRGQVRNWKEGAENYPDSSYRPVQPS